MTTATIERTTTASAVVDEAMRILQAHLDQEARNRRMQNLRPADLCPMQKAEMIQELAALLR